MANRGLTSKEFLDSILTEQEQTYITHFVENERMFTAVRKALLAGKYEQGVIRQNKDKPDALTNIAFSPLFGGMKVPTEISNEELGREVKILWEAINQIEISFDNFLKYKKVAEVSKDNKNPAR